MKKVTRHAAHPVGAFDARAIEGLELGTSWDSRDLSGQVAIVTGGGRGIGRLFAEGLAQIGAAVAVTARSEDQLAETVASITRVGGTALAVAGDVSDPNAVAET